MEYIAILRCHDDYIRVYKRLIPRLCVGLFELDNDEPDDGCVVVDVTIDTIAISSGAVMAGYPETNDPATVGTGVVDAIVIVSNLFLFEHMKVQL